MAELHRAAGGGGADAGAGAGDHEYGFVCGFVCHEVVRLRCPAVAPVDPTAARFPDVPARAGHYESFYLKLCHPSEPLGAWIRYTVHKRPGASADRLAVVHAVRAGGAAGGEARRSRARAPAAATG